MNDCRITSFRNDIAREIGINEAIILEQLFNLLFINQIEEREKHDNKYWIRASAPGINKMFSFFSERQIKFAINNLINTKYIVKQKLSKDRFDNTNYYTITEIGLQHYRNEHYVVPISTIDDNKNVRSIVRKCPTSPSVDPIDFFGDAAFPSKKNDPIDSTKMSDDRHIDLFDNFDNFEKNSIEKNNNLTYISNINYNRDTINNNIDSINNNIKEKEIKKEKEKNQSLSYVTFNTKENEKNQEKEKIQKIFEFWQKTMETKKAILDSKRFNAIKTALLSYPMEMIENAILGCKETPHNMGKNQYGIKYNDISLILRDAAHIERFAHTCELNHTKQNVSKQKASSGKTLQELFPGRDI